MLPLWRNIAHCPRIFLLKLCTFIDVNKRLVYFVQAQAVPMFYFICLKYVLFIVWNILFIVWNINIRGSAKLNILTSGSAKWKSLRSTGLEGQDSRKQSVKGKRSQSSTPAFAASAVWPASVAASSQLRFSFFFQLNHRDAQIQQMKEVIGSLRQDLDKHDAEVWAKYCPDGLCKLDMKGAIWFVFVRSEISLRKVGNGREGRFWLVTVCRRGV